MTAAVTFSGVTRHFGSVRAVDGVDIDIAEGEFFAMLGPSGSGKTTCLRLIAGFEQPTSGDIKLFGHSVRDLPPMEDLVKRIPAPTRELLEELFRARFVTVKRIPQSALK